MIRKLDVYVLREIFFPFVFGLAAFTVIIAGGGVLYDIVSKTLKYGIPIGVAMRLFLYKLPQIISIVLPMATLIGTIVAFGRLKSDNEILAMRTFGISLFRICRSVIIFGVLISVLNVAFNEWVVPKANFNFDILLQNAKSVGIKIKTNVNMTEFDYQGNIKRIVNVKEVNNRDLHDITVAEYESGNLNRLIRSKSGKWHPRGVWEFQDGVMHSFWDDFERVLMVKFEKEYIDIHLDPIAAGKTKKSVNQMNARDLKQWIYYKKSTGQDYVKEMLEYYLKFSLPFACFIFSLVGITVSMGPHRSSSTVGFGLSILIIIIYYVLYTLGMALGLTKLLSPVLSAWFPNVIVGGIAMVIFRRLAFQ